MIRWYVVKLNGSVDLEKVVATVCAVAECVIAVKGGFTPNGVTISSFSRLFALTIGCTRPQIQLHVPFYTRTEPTTARIAINDIFKAEENEIYRPCFLLLSVIKCNIFTYYTVSHKEGSIKLFMITLSNLNRFSKLLHCWKTKEIFLANIRKKLHCTLFMLPHHLGKL